MHDSHEDELVKEKRGPARLFDGRHVLSVTQMYLPSPGIPPSSSTLFCHFRDPKWSRALDLFNNATCLLSPTGTNSPRANRNHATGVEISAFSASQLHSLYNISCKLCWIKKIKKTHTQMDSNTKRLHCKTDKIITQNPPLPPHRSQHIGSVYCTRVQKRGP